MTFLLVLALVIAIFLAVALCVSVFERTGGLCGDSSFVPGIIVAMFVVVMVIVTIGFFTGNIGVWVK